MTLPLVVFDRTPRPTGLGLPYWLGSSWRSISSAALSSLQAQPLDRWQVELEAMQLSPHALPFVHTLQQPPVIRRHVSQFAVLSTSATAITHRPIRIARAYARVRVADVGPVDLTVADRCIPPTAHTESN